MFQNRSTLHRVRSTVGEGRRNLCRTAMVGAAFMLTFAAVAVLVDPPRALFDQESTAVTVPTSALPSMKAALPQLARTSAPSTPPLQTTARPSKPLAQATSKPSSQTTKNPSKPPQASTQQVRKIEFGPMLTTLPPVPPPTERAPDVAMPQCSGPAAGGPLMAQSNRPHKSTRLVEPVPTVFTLPSKRTCRALPNVSIDASGTSGEPNRTDSSITQPSTLPPPLGMDTLVTFAKQAALKPQCDISSLRRWGGFSIPANPCRHGGGSGAINANTSHFGEDDSEGGWASFESHPDDVRATHGTLLARVAWLPSLRKCGSTMMKRYFSHAKSTTQYLARDTAMPHPQRWSDEDIQRHFFKFAVVRDPLQHFLAGAHQL